MARITVEDCIDKFPSRFELVLIASNRARKLHAGDSPTVEKDNDKNTVIALREIAEETITMNDLKNDLIEEYQTIKQSDEEEIPNEVEADEENNPNEELDNENMEDQDLAPKDQDLSEVDDEATPDDKDNEINSDNIKEAE
tara:strand:+ start:160 stop:582 length:423 start_codon:yes stop_codon:yes gene_type:complete